MQKILNKIINIICIVVITFCVLILLVFCFGNKADFIGYRAFRVLSASMEPEIMTDAFVLVKEVDPKELVVGDIISFYSSDPDLEGSVNTHRIVDIQTAEDSDVLIFTTRGDNNLKDDDYTVSEYRVIGKVVYTSLLIGKATTLLSNPLVFGAIIVIPLVLLLYTNIKNLFVATKKAALDEEERQLRQQLEIIKKQREVYAAEENAAEESIAEPEAVMPDEGQATDIETVVPEESQAADIETVEPDEGQAVDIEAVTEEIPLTSTEQIFEDAELMESQPDEAEVIVKAEESAQERAEIMAKAKENQLAIKIKAFLASIKLKLATIDLSVIKTKWQSIDWAALKAKLPKIDFNEIKTKIKSKTDQIDLEGLKNKAKTKLDSVDVEGLKNKAKTKLDGVDLESWKTKAKNKTESLKKDLPKKVKKSEAAAKAEEAPAKKNPYTIEMPKIEMPGLDFDMPEVPQKAISLDGMKVADDVSFDVNMPELDFMKNMDQEFARMNDKFDFK